MSLKGIIDRFTLVSGLEMKDVSRFLPIIEDCRLYFEERLHDGLSEADQRRADHACAVYAFYKISMMGSADALKSFRVGDVQMEPEPLGAYAERLWAEERESIADIVDIGDIGSGLFRSVRV